MRVYCWENKLKWLQHQPFACLHTRCNSHWNVWAANWSIASIYAQRHLKCLDGETCWRISPHTGGKTYCATLLTCCTMSCYTTATISQHWHLSTRRKSINFIACLQTGTSLLLYLNYFCALHDGMHVFPPFRFFIEQHVRQIMPFLSSLSCPESPNILHAWLKHTLTMQLA